MKRIFWLLLFAAFLAGCSTTTNTTPSTPSPYAQLPWKDRQALLNRIQSWQVSGKIAVQTPNDSGSASVDWTEHQGQYIISLMGPMGSNGMTLSGRPGVVILQTSDGKRFTASSPEQILAERWRFHLPVSYLKYWIRGLPVPGLPANTSFDTSGRLAMLSQQGWNVQFADYTNTGKIDLPEKLFITSAALNVKIIIYNWKVM